MSLGDTRSILEQLAAGTISADEAERALDEGRYAEDESGAYADVDRPTVAVRVSSGGRIEVQGDAISAPLVEGPNRCEVVGTTSGYRVQGQVGDDAVVLVPAAAHVELRLNGAAVDVSGLRAPFDAAINAGDVDIECELDEGHSRINLNAGELRLRFGPRSDVLVKVLAPATVRAGDGFAKSGRGQWSLGAGRAVLEINGNLGAISIEAE